MRYLFSIKNLMTSKTWLYDFLHLSDGHLRDYKANGLKVGNAVNTFYPLAGEEAGKVFETSVYDYFTKNSKYKASINYPSWVGAILFFLIIFIHVT